MATEQLLLRLPEELVRKFRRIVPERKRSAFVRKLLEQALAANLDEDMDPLYLIAMAVGQDSRLTAEMAEWEQTVADGLDGAPGH
jgi:metal-responsive CopG/Arc/MetJ family transcriptional regulator